MTLDCRKPNDNRRDFLRESLMLAAIPAGLVSGAAQACVGNLSSKPVGEIRLGLLGCGRRGLQLAAAALGHSNQVKLVSLADVFSDRIQQTYRTLNSLYGQQLQIDGSSRLTGLRAYEQLAQSDVDAVIVAATPESRAKQLLKFTEAGKHVYLESPLAIETEGLAVCSQTAEIAIERGISVCCGMQHRMQPFYQRLVQQLQSGSIGSVLLGQVSVSHPALPVSQKLTRDLAWQIRNWQHQSNLGGHPVVQQLTGSVDLFNWIVSDSPTIRIARQDELGYHVEYVYPSGARLLCNIRTTTSNGSKNSFQLQGSSGWCDLTSGKIFNASNDLVGVVPGSATDVSPALSAWLASISSHDRSQFLRHQNWLVGAATVATQLTIEAAERL